MSLEEGKDEFVRIFFSTVSLEVGRQLAGRLGTFLPSEGFLPLHSHGSQLTTFGTMPTYKVGGGYPPRYGKASGRLL